VNDQLQDLIRDLLDAAGAGGRLKSDANQRASAIQAVGGAVPYTPGPGLRQALVGHAFRQPTTDQASIILNRVADSMADQAVDYIRGRA
jgi:hypothetical protein